MEAFSLKEKLIQLMLDTGRGSAPVVFADDQGYVFDIEDIVFDPENNFFMLSGTEREV